MGTVLLFVHRFTNERTVSKNKKDRRHGGLFDMPIPLLRIGVVRNFRYGLTCDDFAVYHPNHFVGTTRKRIVMRDKNHAATLFTVDFLQQLKDHLSCLRVQVSGRLIGE